MTRTSAPTSFPVPYGLHRGETHNVAVAAAEERSPRGTQRSLRLPGIRIAGFRRSLRRREAWLVLLAVAIGATAGLLVAAMHEAAQFMHRLFFDLPSGGYLSTARPLSWERVLLIPTLGGLMLGLFGLWLGRWNRRLLDPIEANALHGGVLSFRDSLVIVSQTLLSNGVGASVGLEAAYTQISSAVASFLGTRLGLRRSDMRILVGCGTAGAIAAAFGAPLAGAFYCFELILGAYTAASLAPVMTAAMVAVATVNAIGAVPEPLAFVGGAQLRLSDVWFLLPLGLVGGVFGITIMVLVTRVERLFGLLPSPGFLRAAIGGFVLGLLALSTPHVLSSGHAAMLDFFAAPGLSSGEIAAMLILKLMAAAVSLGSGFRGGLFFASLFLGALVGALYAEALAFLIPGSGFPLHVVMLAGMAAVAAAVIGCPLAMAFLTLELAGSLPLALVVLPTTILGSLLVRDTFGYSFATWRFHLRGIPVRSAHDVGLLRNLTVGRMMRRSVQTISADATLREFRRAFPLGSTHRVVATGSSGGYAGIVLVPDAFSPGREADDEAPVSDLVRLADFLLVPEMAVGEALEIFQKAGSEELAVVRSRGDINVLGILTEAHLLRRYTEELEKMRADYTQ